jgi:Heat induced stress protein YflT domain
MTIQPPVAASDPLPDVTPPPDGRPLLTVSSYDDAVAAVDALAEARFPVRHVSIVGRGVRTVEHVTGRWSLARTIASATLTGGLFGLFFGLLFDWWGALDSEVSWGWLAFYGLAYGALAGLLVSLLFARAGQRDFSSVRTIDADHYDLILTGGERAEAMRMLHDAGLV